jgi:hypothetical protein
LITIQQQWKFYWQQPFFKKLLIGIVIANIIVLTFLPHFFAIIETRQGMQLNDWLLNQLTPTNCSLLIFICIWGSGLLVTIRAVQQPLIALQFLGSFLLLTLCRMVSISLVPLNPPIGLIPVVDPLSNYFYPNGFITKDLFFSGHTSTQLLMFFTLQKRADKIFTLITSFAVGFLVLVQHIHYTIDVLVAIPCSYAMYWMAKKWWVTKVLVKPL